MGLVPAAAQGVGGQDNLEAIIHRIHDRRENANVGFAACYDQRGYAAASQGRSEPSATEGGISRLVDDQSSAPSSAEKMNRN